MMAVEQLVENIPISRACNLMGIPRRTYYNRKHFKNRTVNTRITSEIVIRIGEICSERITYGYRRIWAMLRNEGIYLNQKTVLSIMKRENLSLEPHRHLNRKGWKKLIHPNSPDQLWEMDLTYIPTMNEGMTYLFNVKDCFTKEWIEYYYSRTCNRKDALNSIEDVLLRHPERYPDAKVTGITLRSDNGDQYTSHYFMEHVKAMGFIQEFIEKSTPEQDGDIESFHMSFKTDYIWVIEIKDFSEGMKVIGNAFIDYNNVRPHSSIEYLPPAVFRERYLKDSEFRKKYDEKLKGIREKRKERNRMRNKKGNVGKKIKEVE
ncbi:MAG: IS3 family transposase [Cuniculiplasma sp.]